MYDGTVEIQPSALFRVLFLGQLGIHEQFSFNFQTGFWNPPHTYTLHVDIFPCYTRNGLSTRTGIFIRSYLTILNYLELEMLRVKIPFKNNTGFPFTVE